MFEYDLGSRLKLKESDEEGEVIARAQYAVGDNCYLIRYKAGDGRQVESWWNASSVTAA